MNPEQDARIREKSEQQANDLDTEINSHLRNRDLWARNLARVATEIADGKNTPMRRLRFCVEQLEAFQRELKAYRKMADTVSAIKTSMFAELK